MAKICFSGSYLAVEVLLVAAAAAWAACQDCCPGGVDGHHDLAAQSLVLDAHAVGVDHAEGRELRKGGGGSPVKLQRIEG